MPSSSFVCINVSLYGVTLHGVKTECQYMGFNTQIHSMSFAISRGLDTEDFNVLGTI